MPRVLRLFSALAILGIVGRYMLSAVNNGQTIAEYLSYFSVLGGLGAAVVLLLLALWPGLSESPAVAWLRGVMTLSLCCAAVFFIWEAAAPVDVAKHALAPLIMLADWVRDRPNTRSHALVASWSIGPVVYFAYALVRGATTGWYPYHIIDPRFGGYSRLAVTTVVMVVIMSGLAIVLKLIADARLESSHLAHS